MKINPPAILAACSILTVFIFVISIYTPLGVASAVPYIVVILVSLWLSTQWITLLFTVICSVLTVWGYFLSPGTIEPWKAITNRGLTLGVIWVTAWLGIARMRLAIQERKNLEARNKALEEMKTLQGLLPICASCKKIRNDKGYWEQLESYIRDHSEAVFTHSICQECAHKLYGVTLDSPFPPRDALDPRQ